MYLMKYRAHLNTIDNFLYLHFILKWKNQIKIQALPEKTICFC
jgi:hypothetical protein